MRFYYVLLLLVFSNVVFAVDTIVWLKPNMPPYNIQTGELQGQGRIDLIEQLFQDALPEYKHIETVSSYSRILQEIVNKDNICSAALLKDEKRAEFIAFSEPYMIGLSNRLVIKKEDEALIQEYITSKGEVDLDRLLNYGNFTLGIAKDRKYGSEIDTIIKSYRAGKSVYQRGGEDQLKSLIAMSLLGNRGISGFLSNPDQVNFLLDEKKVSRDKFIFFEIKGNPPYLLGYMGCVKNGFGREVINKINEIILQKRSNTFADINERWIDMRSHEKYRGWIKEIFGH